MKRMHELCRLNTTTIVEVARNAVRQKRQRHLEHAVRVNAARFCLAPNVQSFTNKELAALLGLAPRTLRQWQKEYVCESLQPHSLGRPLQRAGVAERNEVIEVLDTLGPATGLPTLQEYFPALARAELADILCRYRRVWRKLNLHAAHRLRWPVIGRVWAMDFTDPPRAIDGLYPHLLAVRDLASGAQLLWLPVFDMTAATARNALASLFAGHGAPLVLKIDNGSAFIDAGFLALLSQAEVIPLFSPPRLPKYNGSAESGIGSLKTRTEVQATHHGRPGQWTCADAATAREQANATCRPRGTQGPTAVVLWQTRTTITTDERQRFLTAIQSRRLEARHEANKTVDQLLPPGETRSLDRKAIRRALVELGYLVFRRRRIPLAFKNKKMTNIT
jgi:transposase InsO family protein